MNIIIIDGQGGKIGRLLVSQLKAELPDLFITAIGTNAIATTAMVKAGADQGATGENPVLVLSETADVIIGPLGIVIANSLLGEITPAMSVAVGKSRAEKFLLPISQCRNTVVGVAQLPLSTLVEQVVAHVILKINETK